MFKIMPCSTTLTSRAAWLTNIPHPMSNGSANAPTPSPTAVAIIKPTDLRGILQYVPRFKDQIFVIALDGAIIADENFTNLLVDIAVLRSLAIKVVLVHGIGQQLQELAQTR